MARNEGLQPYVKIIENHISIWKESNAKSPCKMVIGLYSYSPGLDAFVEEVLKHQGHEIISLDMGLLRYVNTTETHEFLVNMLNDASTQAKSLNNPVIHIERLDLLDSYYMSSIELLVESGPFFKKEGDENKHYIPFVLTSCSEFSYATRSQMTDYYYMPDSILDYSPVVQKLHESKNRKVSDARMVFRQEQIDKNLNEASRQRFKEDVEKLNQKIYDEYLNLDNSTQQNSFKP